MNLIKFTSTKMPFGWMGNMAGFWDKTPLNISCDGKSWNSSENLFQAMRFNDDKIIRLIAAPNGYYSKIVAKKHKEHMCIEPMAEQDVCNMCYIVLLKIVQHPILLNELLNGTGEIIDNGYVNPFGEDTLIIEDVSFRMGGSGLFWGAAKIPNSEMWAGYNILGEIFCFWVNLNLIM